MNQSHSFKGKQIFLGLETTDLCGVDGKENKSLLDGYLNSLVPTVLIPVFVQLLPKCCKYCRKTKVEVLLH